MKTILRCILVATTVLAGPVTAHAQSTGTVYGFGDSLTDNGFSTRIVGTNYLVGLNPNWTNNRATNGLNYFDTLIPKIGASPISTGDYAVAGAISGPYQGGGGRGSLLNILAPELTPNILPALTDQVSIAISQVGRFRPNDLAVIWIGTNEFQTGIIPNRTPAQSLELLNRNLNSSLLRLAVAGAKNFVVLNLNSTQEPNAEQRAQFNQGLPSLLTSFSQPGLNVHLFDVDSLLAKVRANPTAYGFAANAGTVLCDELPSCRGGTTTNQYITFENVHFTQHFNDIISSYIANQLNAPLTIGPQADLGQAAGLAFSSTLIDFLSAERRRNMAMSVPAAFAADLPGRVAPPSTIPIQVGSPLSLFALGTYASVDRTVQNRGSGNIGNTYGADFGGVTAGVMYQATPSLLLGAAFNYLNTSVDLRGLSNGRIDVDSFQGAGFASLSFPDFFADAAFTYGSNNYTVDRPGVLNDRLSASPGGDTFTASARVGYLFDFGTFKAGPVGEVAYSNVHVDAYRESGDPLLTMGVRRQNLEGLTAGGGLQVRTTLPAFGGLISPFLNVTAQHDFLDGVRSVTSFQTYAPTLLIRTQTGRFSDDVYGSVAGGLDLDLGNGLSGVLTGSTSFARAGGDDHTVSAGLRYRF